MQRCIGRKQSAEQAEKEEYDFIFRLHGQKDRHVYTAFQRQQLQAHCKVGTDQDPDAGYIIHVVWNATAKPAEKSHETMNDSPDAETFSWECDTVPVNIADLKAAAVAEFDSTELTAKQMKAVEDLLYGTDSEEAKLPTPDELLAAVKAAV